MDPITIAIILAGKWISNSRAKNKEKERARVEREQARFEQVRAKEAEREEVRQRAQRCCAACSTIVVGKVRFCHHCGGSKLTTVGAIQDERATKARLRQQEREAIQKREDDMRLMAQRTAERERQQKLAEEQAR